MPLRIERRPPAALYRKPKKWRLRDHIPVAAVAKYAALTLTGYLLFRAGQARALVERGYEALGGEAFALFLPVLYWMVSRTVRDMLNARRKKDTWRWTKHSAPTLEVISARRCNRENSRY